jgi:DNA recombination-mediator protein A
MVCARDATIPLAGLLIGSPMRKFRFALLSVVFIALAMGVCALQAGAALYQWLTGRTRRTSHRDRPEDRKSHVRHCRGRFIRLLGPRCRVIPARPDSKIVAGDLELLDRPSLAIVGTRDPTENGEFLARYAVSSRREAEAPVVSGLAYGIDRLVHEWCLNISLPTDLRVRHGHLLSTRR